MPYNKQTRTIIKPTWDITPLPFLERNALDIFLAQQNVVFGYFNNKWASRIGYEVKELDPKQCHVGFPLSLNARSLHIFANQENKDKDNYKEQIITLNFIYNNENADLAGNKASQFSPSIISGFYLSNIEAIWDTVPITELLYDWPINLSGEDDDPASAEINQIPGIKKLNSQIANPDAKFPTLSNLGVQAYYSFQIQLYPQRLF